MILILLCHSRANGNPEITFMKEMDSCFRRNDNQRGEQKSRNSISGITASLRFPLPFAGITQTGSEGLSAL